MTSALPILLVSLLTYLPGNWNAKHAEEDIANADAVVICRCVGIRQVESQMTFVKPEKSITTTARCYVAELRVQRSLAGTDLAGTSLQIGMGYDEQLGESDDFAPAHEGLTMHNSQRGYDLRTNQVYVLHLTKGAHGYDLRSGPFSIGWLKPDNRIVFGKLGGEWQEPVAYDAWLQRVKR